MHCSIYLEFIIIRQEYCIKLLYNTDYLFKFNDLQLFYLTGFIK